MCFSIISCKSTKNWKVVERNLNGGREGCRQEILGLLDDDDIYAHHISYLGSVPAGVVSGFTGTSFIYDKKFKEIPSRYHHRFKLEKDSVINYEFTLTSDEDGRCLVDYNSDYRDYPLFVEYFNLIKNEDELNELIKFGIEYFGDDRFDISISNSSRIDDDIERKMTRNEISEIREIQKRRKMFELVDRDATHNEFMQQFRQQGIVVVPETYQIISNFIKLNDYVY